MERRRGRKGKEGVRYYVSIVGRLGSSLVVEFGSLILSFEMDAGFGSLSLLFVISIYRKSKKIAGGGGGFG